MGSGHRKEARSMHKDQHMPLSDETMDTIGNNLVVVW
jgi:hypothetical protein